MLIVVSFLNVAISEQKRRTLFISLNWNKMNGFKCFFVYLYQRNNILIMLEIAKPELLLSWSTIKAE